MDRAMMAQWMGKLGFELEILADYVQEGSKGRTGICRRDDVADVVPRVGQNPKGLFMGLCPDDRPFGGSGPPMVAYRFEDSRCGDCVARHLKGYTGILQVDGYTAYNRVAKTCTGGNNETATLAGCWAHFRRRFYELHTNGSSRLATETVTDGRALVDRK